MEFKVGNRVIVKIAGQWEEGTIIDIQDSEVSPNYDSKVYCIKLDKWLDIGHALDGKVDEGYGWYAYREEMKLLYEEDEKPIDSIDKPHDSIDLLEKALSLLGMNVDELEKEYSEKMELEKLNELKDEVEKDLHEVCIADNCDKCNYRYDDYCSTRKAIDILYKKGKINV